MISRVLQNSVRFILAHVACRNGFPLGIKSFFCRGTTHWLGCSCWRPASRQLSQLPELAQQPLCQPQNPAFLQQWSTFLDLIFSNALTSLLLALSILQLPCLAPTALTVLSGRLLKPIGEVSLWNEKNVDSGPIHGSCFCNSPS